MGLDITAFANLTLIPDAEVDADGLPIDQSHLNLSPRIAETVKHWPDRCAALRPGIYTASQTMSFSAGSYSGYGEFRRLLAKSAGYTDEDAWRVPCSLDPASRFLPLVNFSDCEGVIDHITAARLAADFTTGRDAFLKVAGSRDERTIERYDRWTAATHLAAQNGAIVFC